MFQEIFNFQKVSNYAVFHIFTKVKLFFGRFICRQCRSVKINIYYWFWQNYMKFRLLILLCFAQVYRWVDVESIPSDCVLRWYLPQNMQIFSLTGSVKFWRNQNETILSSIHQKCNFFCFRTFILCTVGWVLWLIWISSRILSDVSLTYKYIKLKLHIE